jgi:hypothetical protein
MVPHALSDLPDRLGAPYTGPFAEARPSLSEAGPKGLRPSHPLWGRLEGVPCRCLKTSDALFMLRTGRDIMAVAAKSVEVKELTQEEGFALLDRQARQLLGMSGEDFIAAWDAGAFNGNTPERSEVVTVAMLLPFGRPD